MKSTRLINKALWATGCVLMTLPALRADDSNYQRYMVGDRAAGMGGAVVSIADGVDAAYYNPAGLGNIKANTLSISPTCMDSTNTALTMPGFPTRISNPHPSSHPNDLRQYFQAGLERGRRFFRVHPR